MIARNVAIINQAFVPQARAWFDAMLIKPQRNRMIAYSEAISVLVKSGIWPKLDAVYFFAMHTEQAALLNLKSPGTLSPTAVNAPVFTPMQGYNGDGVAAYIDTGITWPVMGGMSQNNASIGAAVITTGGNGVVLGATNSYNGLTRNATMTTRLSTNVAVNGDALIANQLQFLAASRNDPNNYDRYIDGVAVTPAIGNVSNALSPSNMTFLRLNTGYAIAAVRTMGGYAGQYLNATENAITAQFYFKMCGISGVSA